MKLVNLTSRLNSSESFLNAAALFDVLLIALMFTLVSSRFVLAPGMSIQLASLDKKAAEEDLAIVDADLSVLNAKSNTMLIFDGAVYTPETFKMQMKKAATEKTNGRNVLLIKADKSVDAQMLLEICRVAKQGGFSRVHIAAIESKGESD